MDILFRSADLHVRDRCGWTVAHHATYCNKLAVLERVRAMGFFDREREREVEDAALLAGASPI